MRLKIERNALADALSWAAESLSARPAAPVLAGLRLAAEGEELAVSGFDYETATSGSVPAQVDEPGAVLISGRLLADIVRALPERPVELATDGAALRLVCGPYRYTLQTMPLGDYPEPPAPPETTGDVSGSAFASAVAQVAVAVGRDDTLPFLTGVRIEANDDLLRLVSTDRYRLAVRELPWQPVHAGLQTSVLVPARVLGPLSRALARSERVSLALPEDGARGEGVLGLQTPRRSATARLLDGEFIKYERLFPADYAGHAVIKTAALVDAVKSIALVAERNTPIRLSFRAGQVTVEAGSDDAARARVTIDAEFTGADIAIAPNPEYLLDGLAALGTAYARVQYTTPAKPAVLTGLPAPDADADQTYRYLFIPVRVSQ